MENQSDRQTLSDAYEAFRRERPDEAIRLLLPLCERDDAFSAVRSEAMQLYGIVLHDRGEIEQAAATIEKAEQMSPLNAVTRIALASAYASLGRVGQARDLYLRMAIKRDLPSRLMLEIAAGLEAVGAPQSAVQVCQWVIDAEPSNPQAHYDMGFYSARAGQPLYLSEAMTHRAIQLDPKNISFRVGLASLLIQLDREDEAIAALNEIGSEELRHVTCEDTLHRIASVLERHRRVGLARVFRVQASSLSGSNALAAGGLS
ncbi:MAG: tetratricopeptide repeat protein [Planctomycetota bacterium]